MRKLVLLLSVAAFGVSASYAAERRLEKIVESEIGELPETVLFKYFPDGAAFAGRLMEVDDEPEGEQGIIKFNYDKEESEKSVEITAGGPMSRQYNATLHIGANGYVENAHFEYPYMFESGDVFFTYDAEGHLTEVKIVEDEETSLYTFTYTDGNITTLECQEDEEDITTISFEYSDIPNTGNMMFYESFYGLDIEVMEYAFFAGLMGTSSKELPTKAIYKDDYETETTNIDWTLDSQNYPVKMSTLDGTIEFTWSEVASVNTLSADKPGTETIYGIDGTSRKSLQPGINIIRNSDGGITKTIGKH